MTGGLSRDTTWFTIINYDHRLRSYNYRNFVVMNRYRRRYEVAPYTGNLASRVLPAPVNLTGGYPGPKGQVTRPG